MSFGEVHEGEYVRLRFIEERRELWELRTELIGDGAPLLARGAGGLLREDGVDERQHHLPLAFAGVRQCVANEVHATPLPSGLEHLCDRRFESQMRVGDHQLYPA